MPSPSRLPTCSREHIASFAWHREATLLSHDADMDRLANVIGIEIDEASMRA